MTVDLHPVDLAIVGLYLVVVVWIGLRLSKKHETAEEYFLAGRKLSWPFVGLSLYASNQSASSLVGMAAAGYAAGVAVFNYEWFAVVVLVVFAVFFLPYYLRSGIYTLPQFLELRFDQRSRYYHSAVTITGNLLIDTAGSLYASALIVLAHPPRRPAVAVGRVHPPGSPGSTRSPAGSRRWSTPTPSSRSSSSWAPSSWRSWRSGRPGRGPRSRRPSARTG